MNEESRNDTVQTSKSKKKHRGWRMLMLIIGIPLVFFALLSAYLYINLYDVDFQPETLAQYQARLEAAGTLQSTDGVIDYKIPQAVVSTELTLKLRAAELASGLQVDAVIADTAAQRIRLNLRQNGLHFPAELGYSLNYTENTITVSVTDINLGGKLIKKDEASAQALLDRYAPGMFPIRLDLSDAVDGRLAAVEGIASGDDGVTILLRIDARTVESWLTMLADSVNPVLLEGMKAATDETSMAAVKLLEKTTGLTGSDVDRFVNHILKQDAVIGYLLMLADTKTQEAMLSTYGIYLGGLDQGTLAADKMNLLLPSLKAYHAALMQALSRTLFSQETMYIQKGQPYRLGDHLTMNVAQVNVLAGLNIPEIVVKDLQFAYDVQNKKLITAYAIDSDYMVVMNDGDAALIGRAKFEEDYGVTDSGKARKMDSLAVYYGIQKASLDFFQSQKVYLRYVRIDDKYAFVIASPDFKLQNYWMMAFEKNDQGVYELLAGNITSLKSFNEAYPQFNMDLLTDEVSKVKLYNLEADYLETILKDLTNKHKIAAGSTTTLAYYAYGNQYIALQLSDGREMVYLVDRLYLKTVYDKDVAVKAWKDIPDILLLEDKPAQ